MFDLLSYENAKKCHNILRFCEIDETLFYKLKKGRNGRILRTKIWVVGIIERNSNKSVFYSMRIRKKWRILSIIFKHVKIGSTIYTDSFSTYINNQSFPKISYLESLGYRHFAIDHSLRKFLKN